MFEKDTRDYRWNQRGFEVEELQTALLDHGFALPKYGADGHLGNETWTKLESFAGVDDLDTDQVVPHLVLKKLFTDFAEGCTLPPGFVQVQGDPRDVHGMRQWSDLTTIVLHQTGCWMSDNPERFRTMNAHIGILADHETPIVQVQDLLAYMHHANKANKFSVGIEINGLFPGRVVDYRTKTHTGLGPSASQVRDARLAVQYVCDIVRSKGGQVQHIIPHRCVNPTRRSDPGEVAWKQIGVWAQQELGLTDGGPGWKMRKGRPIPVDWDARPVYSTYSY